MQFWSHCYTVVSYQALFRLSVYKIPTVYLLGAKNVCFCTIRDFGSPTIFYSTLQEGKHCLCISFQKRPASPLQLYTGIDIFCISLIFLVVKNLKSNEVLKIKNAQNFRILLGPGESTIVSKLNKQCRPTICLQYVLLLVLQQCGKK